MAGDACRGGERSHFVSWRAKPRWSNIIIVKVETLSSNACATLEITIVFRCQNFVTDM
jgi:hypothetical protein